jgi:hypothetical protein
MSRRIKRIIFSVSVTVNVLFLVLFALALSGRPPEAFSFYQIQDETEPYASSALVVSAPARPDTVSFNPVELTLQPGEQASLQLSALFEGRQANWLLNALYDHDMIRIEKTGFGIVITALVPGVSSLQLVGDSGITDFAVVNVIE